MPCMLVVPCGERKSLEEFQLLFLLCNKNLLFPFLFKMFRRVNGKQRFPRVRRIYYDTNAVHGEEEKPYSVLYCNKHAAILRDNGNDSEDEDTFVEDCTWLRFPGRTGRRAISKPGSHVPNHSNLFVENDNDSILSTDDDSDDSGDMMSDTDSSDNDDLSSADSIDDDEVGELDDDICKIGKSDHEVDMSRKEVLKKKADEKERKRKKKEKRMRRRERKRQKKLRKQKKNGEKRKREPTKPESARDRLEKRLAGRKQTASAGAGPSLGGPSRPGGKRNAVGKSLMEPKKRPVGLAREPERYIDNCIKKEEEKPKEEKPKPKKGPIKLMNLFNGKGVKWS